MISDKQRKLLEQFAPTPEAYQTLAGLVEDIVEENNRIVQEKYDNARYYLNNTTDLLIELDKNGKVVYANEHVSAVTRYAVDELIGRNWFDLVIPSEERDAAIDVFHKAIVGELASTHYSENRILDKSGKEYLIAWRNACRRDPLSDEITGVFSSGEDITVLRDIENKIHQNELRYRQMFHSNNAIKLVLNPRTGAIVDANQAACEYYGYDYVKLTGMNITDINPLPREQLLGDDQRNLSHRRTYQFQHRLASGELRDVQVYTGPLTNDGEELQYSIVLDVTEREKAKQVLQEREAQFRMAVNHFPNGMLMMFDTDLNCIIARGQVLFTGIEAPEQLEGYYLPDVLPENIWQDAKALYEEALRGESSQRYFEDDERQLLVQVEPLYDDEQRIIGGLHLFQDISHLHQYERIIKDTKTQLDTILDGILDGVAIISPDEYLMYANDAAARIVGFESVQEMMDKMQDNLLINHSPLDENGKFLEFQDQALYHALQGETPPPQTIIFRNDESGKEIWAETKVKPILDEDGKVRFAVIILTDITRARQIEQFRMKAVEEQTQIKTLREYIASTTHDLSQPLSVINTAIYMLDKAVQDEQVQKRTASIKAQSIRMQSILQDIRQISVLDSISHLDFNPVDIAQLLGQIATYTETRISEQGKTFRYDCELNRKTIIGNAQYLERAITQLIQNAIDYTQEQGQIRLACHLKSGNIVIEVQDDGIGIPPEHQSHIFERFYRVDKSRTASPTSGTGLGLSITRRIMELHGGEIEVESEAGQGSTFRLILPLQFSD